MPEVIEEGLTVQLAPLGQPPTVRFTVCGLPLVTAVEMPLVPVEFWLRVRLVGLALIEKSFGGTVRVTVVEWVAEVPVPVTVMVYVPGAAVPAPTVSVELPPDWIGLGLKVQLAPLGHPLVERVTDCALPDVIVVEMVLLPEAPWLTVTLLGLALMEKSFVGTSGQFASLKVAMRVLQLNVPFAGMYSCVYQNEQSSLGSTAIML